MKISISVLAVLCSASLFFSCGETGTNQDNVDEDTFVQTEEAVDMEDDIQNARNIEVVAENMEYKPNEIRVSPGQQLTITLVNRGNENHNIEFELPDGEQELENPVEPGASASLSFKAPDQPGTYTIYCPVDNHKEKGMTGKLIVE
ncbi:cupredoxin domain-containing protein [Cesiribacter sp. SM1]|uniref:cupredoxin domain-containing protein n=1 Tax=Cesiribacter sp. SM1 TaxID=2861196 RepID=UPI001CD47397|nr:cupredoxin domain-containing protein [Cesiribacter sp. SM1]